MSTYIDKVRRENEKRARNKAKTALSRTKPRKVGKRLKKQSKAKISVIQRLLWVECKRIIRVKYGNTCYTCDKRSLAGGDWQTAHFIPNASGGAFLRFNLRNLRPCCYNCNINLGGNGAVFYKRMVEREGQEYVDEIFKDKQKIVKAYDHYTALLEEYKML